VTPAGVTILNFATSVLLAGIFDHARARVLYRRFPRRKPVRAGPLIIRVDDGV
jgi:hypothetical protein